MIVKEVGGDVTLKPEKSDTYVLYSKDRDVNVRVIIDKNIDVKVVLRGIAMENDMCLKGDITVVKGVKSKSELIIEGYRLGDVGVCVEPGLEIESKTAEVSHSAFVKTLNPPLYVKSRGLTKEDYIKLIEEKIYEGDH